MQNALEYILNIINVDIVEPFKNALANSLFISDLTSLINNFLSAIFNIFRGTPTNKFDNLLNVNSIAIILGFIFFIIFILLVYNLFRFVFSTCSSMMKYMILSNEDIKGTKEWRRQWRRKKWKRFLD